MLARCEIADSQPVQRDESAVATVSVVIRVRTSGDEILRLLRAISRQTYQPSEVVLVDSGSSPRIISRLRHSARHGLPGNSPKPIPVHLLEISPEDYQSARTLNKACSETTSQLIAIVSQDALPSITFIEKMAAAFVEERTVGVYGRQRVRESPDPLVEKDLAKTYPPTSRLQHAPDCWVVNTGSMVRRQFWQAHPFDEHAGIAEDHEWARWWQAKGYCVKYEAEAIVLHYHPLATFAEIWNRFYPEGRSLAYVHRQRKSLPRCALCLARDILSDGLWLARRRELRHWPRGAMRRAVKHDALYQGSRDGFHAVRSKKHE